ncbi:MAG: S8 family serine peptidase [Pyrinomonadaceae bacterium]|nr:S8 family serine peptidase [Pyrinomonadaceae bacterium]
MVVVKLVCGFILAFLFSTQFVFAQYNSKMYADGELLVKYKSEKASETASRANEQIGARIVEKFTDLKWQRVKLPEGLSVERALARYQNMAEVESVQPNYYYHLLATPNDPQFSSMYGLQKISAPAAWNLTVGSSDTVVAVIDTGVKYNHEDLAANMWKNPGEINGNGVDDDGNGFVDDYYGYDFFYNDSDPADENGHGTHTAGTIGAVGNNALGVTGVNWNVRLMAIKIYSPLGTDTTSAMLINAYNYVRMMKTRGVNIRVTNNSYGGCNEACDYDQATKEAIDALGNAGILNVFAAGNDNANNDNTPFYPASYTSPSILSVAASTPDDLRSNFSNYGAVSVDIAAPGSSILSTHSSSLKYATLSGTSMAAPHAAGTAALLYSYNPNLSPQSLKATLMNTVDVLPQWNGVVKTGGRLNAARALQNQTICTFTAANDSIIVPTKGGYFTVNVAAAPNCDFSVKSNAKWIQINGADALSGNSAVSFRVLVNPTISRIGTITIAGQTFTVRQSRI